MARMVTRGLATPSLIILLVLAAADFSRAADVAPLIQNNRVIVWDVLPGSQAPATNPSHDVVTFVIRGDKTNAQGEVRYRVKGAASEPAPADTRRVVIELQDAKVAPLVNSSGYPLAFPRLGSKKLFENDRVVVWSFTWTPGVATPMHFHDKDVVVTYLADGALTSTDAQGRAVVNEHHFGYTKFNARDRVHTELLARGQGSAMMVELK
jgi:predicted metal-dependent enzyme (double-stranded beta helix superfamily)